MRTIWVALRAVNYSRPAFSQATSQVKALQAWQQRLMNQQKQMERQSRMMIGVGLMYSVMGAMVGFAIGKMISMSREGSQYMEKFSQVAGKAAAEIGKALFDTLKPALDVVLSLLRIISENKALATMIGHLMILVSTMLVVQGISKILGGVWMRMGMQALITGQVGLKGLVKGLFEVNIAANGLLATTMKLFGIFYVFFAVSTALADALGGPLQAAIVMLIPLLAVLVGMLWAGATAVSIISVGVAAAAGIAGMVAAQQSIPEFQTGTRFAQRTQPALVHAGEKITPARDVADEMRPSVTHITNQIDFSNATINTKADKEELVPFIKRAMRDAMRGKE